MSKGSLDLTVIAIYRFSEQGQGLVVANKHLLAKVEEFWETRALTTVQQPFKICKTRSISVGCGRGLPLCSMHALLNLFLAVFCSLCPSLFRLETGRIEVYLKTFKRGGDTASGKRQHAHERIFELCTGRPVIVWKGRKNFCKTRGFPYLRTTKRVVRSARGRVDATVSIHESGDRVCSRKWSKTALYANRGQLRSCPRYCIRSVVVGNDSHLLRMSYDEHRQ